MNTKQNKLGAELKALDEKGHGLVRIAVLSEIDSDGDTYMSGAFGEQWAQILAAHNWNSVPLGKARVFEDGDQALAEIHINLETEAGRDWHAALKFDLEGCCGGAPNIQEWSYGFLVLDSQSETRDGKRVRVLKKLDVFEVSPVVKGAGVGTGTLSIKQAGTFQAQLDATEKAVRDVVARAKDVAALRAGDGRTLSDERLAQLAALKQALGDLRAVDAEIDALIGAGAVDADAAAKAVGAYVRRQSRRHLPGDA